MLRINSSFSLAGLLVAGSIAVGCGKKDSSSLPVQQEGPQIEVLCSLSGPCSAYVKGVSVAAARDTNILRRIREEIKPFRTCPDDRIAAKEVTGGIIIYIASEVQTNLGNLHVPK
jgi:hypothetical protein